MQLLHNGSSVLLFVTVLLVLDKLTYQTGYPKMFVIINPVLTHGHTHMLHQFESYYFLY